jgi:hypothetical protein
MSKQVYDLTPEDIATHAVWVFPMDDSVIDEASVRPVQLGEDVPDGLQRLTRARFVDANGRCFPGYIYPGAGTKVEDERPVAWCGSLCITFWNGMCVPSAEYLEKISKSNVCWPVTYEADVDGLKSKQGLLDGIYYFADGKVRVVK